MVVVVDEGHGADWKEQEKIKPRTKIRNKEENKEKDPEQK